MAKYINADEAKGKIARVCFCRVLDEETEKDLMQAIDEMPSADVVEVKHGEMTKHIDADGVKEKCAESCKYVRVGNEEYLSVGDVCRIVDNMPSADVVEVIRCKDCKYSVCIGEHYFCDIQYDEWGQPYVVKQDGFCDVAERKETE